MYMKSRGRSNGESELVSEHAHKLSREACYSFGHKASNRHLKHTL